jgi:signal transduction histidine kinase
VNERQRQENRGTALPTWPAGVDLAQELAFVEAIHDVGTRDSEQDGGVSIFSHALDMTIDLAGGDVGYAYAVDGGLAPRLVAARGVLGILPGADGQVPPCVHTALARGRRVFEEPADGMSPAPSSTADGARGCQCTPILNRSGGALGAVVTYFAMRRRPADRQLELVDRVMKHVADFIVLARLRSDLEARLTKEQRSRAAAEASSGRTDDFLAALSHELRQPLAAALVSVGLQKHAVPRATRTRALAVLETQLHQAIRLVDDLAQFAHAPETAPTLRRRRLDLRQVIERAWDMTQPMFDARRHTRAVALGTKPVWVEADAERMTQVFSNLLRNAAGYTPPGGVIRVWLERDHESTLVRLQDNGIGIPSKLIGRIFDRFQRAASAAEPSNRGIGLAIVRQLVELHGGEVRVSSPGAGLGSEFTVRLPLAPDR